MRQSRGRRNGERSRCPKSPPRRRRRRSCSRAPRRCGPAPSRCARAWISRAASGLAASRSSSGLRCWSRAASTRGRDRSFLLPCCPAAPSKKRPVILARWQQWRQLSLNEGKGLRVMVRQCRRTSGRSLTAAAESRSQRRPESTANGSSAPDPARQHRTRGLVRRVHPSTTWDPYRHGSQPQFKRRRSSTGNRRRACLHWLRQ